LISERLSILIKETLFKVPLFGLYLRRTGHVPMVAGQGRAHGGGFPRRRHQPAGGRVSPAGTGAARLALRTGAPVIPVGIHLQRERIMQRITYLAQHSAFRLQGA
jgi:1-acyl-sn-glycerol-3-phosphate acyltransferase